MFYYDRKQCFAQGEGEGKGEGGGEGEGEEGRDKLQ